MKVEEKKNAIRLRKKGYSMNDIVRELQVSKASVSLWVRNVSLTHTQRKNLTARGFSVDAVEKRRMSRIARTREEHRILTKHAGEEISSLSQHELWFLGIALYWGEGGKTHHGMVRIANSDPAVIQIMMRFFREICNVPEAKFNGHVHTFSHLNAKKAEEYWSNISGIPRQQFYKTYIKQSVASKNKRDTLPYGTFQIYVCDTKLFLRIMGWIERIKELSKL
jgi:predicted transcriptional regulator